jgi:tripeptide aminopeptidase
MACVPPSTTTPATKSWGIYPNPAIFPEPVIALDVELLTALCSIQGKSGDEGDMQAFILDYLLRQGLTPHSDANGNITCTKGEADAFPCMVAHMDTVHSRYRGYTAALSVDGLILYACADSVSKVNDNLPLLSEPSSKVQVGVGGDDRCGIYVALHLLTLLPAFKVCFVIEEEIGMQRGSRFVDMDFFSDAAIVLQCDRKGHDDWVQTVSGTQVSGDDFISSIRDLLVLHKYTVTQHGGPTDVGALKSRGLGVVAANMSCGYYNPHSSSETIWLPALENTLNLCAEVLERVGYVKQVHLHATRPASSTSYGNGSSYQQHNTRWNSRVHTTYKERNKDPFGANFSTLEYGWSWTSKDELEKLFKVDVTHLNVGGFTKVVGENYIGPYNLVQVKDYEREQAEDKELKAANEQAKLAKEEGSRLRLGEAHQRRWTG